ncbi:hypothetical protein Alches_13100 [Alicyclobacillus hesperidum subsp. aegles]|uniref:hypothetical protein n=1 Tax=Alicyclobacillus hesperidum TaxID=89784 RepID=UPI00071935DE|nr:hypothetical protein [Alicyclobacillus hesperidum]KRW91046.1 hypothetical protein SD51_11275 [Alicyclobacillus tengchongensis]GLG01271.1 hypothetical protein Alches_13100 [Alicyclobacillus hesperidum subsp. aegles]
MAKKMGRRMLLIALVITVVQVLVFYHYNKLFSSNNLSTPDRISSSPSMQRSIAREIATLKQKYKFVTPSADDQYVAYLGANNVLHVMDLQTKQDVCEANNPYSVEYVEWIQDERVFVGEQVMPGDLELKTVDVPSGMQTIVTRFQGLEPDAAFAKITFSTLTNDIYILINTSSTSALYHIGTMSHVTQVPIGGRFIKNIALTATGDNLYFEDYMGGSFNVLYFDSQDVAHLVKLNAALVDVVGNTLYYGDINSEGLVTAVYRYSNQSGQSALVKTLATPTLAANIDITDAGGVTVDSSST